jgi:UDP-2,3-diacylglucosamine pyrophosphatase LpxH
LNKLKKIDEIYKNAYVINITKSSRLVFMSDLHRGDGSGADNARPNRNIFVFALNYYYENNFSYFEIGDGDELWENSDMSSVKAAHASVFNLISLFAKKKRYFPLFGNHDGIKSNKDWVTANYPIHTPFYESILLKFDTGAEILLMHGHQVDFINYELASLSSFLVRFVWRPLELLGIRNPFSPVNNQTSMHAIEKSLADWSIKNNIMLLAGHTHRTIFPRFNEPMYFNDGCGVYPQFITAIEITKGEISLVKWYISVDANGFLQVQRKVLESPKPISKYFSTKKTVLTINDNRKDIIYY